MPGLVKVRHDLHRHPELGYQEKRTSGVIARELTSMGVKHVTGLARGTGVLAHIPATVGDGEAGDAIALRADMDALPISEQTGLEYSSVHAGVMHACGHDGHTTNLLGVARVLMKVPSRPRSVTLIFQPAEEGGGGGLAMCNDGVLDGRVIGPPVKMVFGLHGWPQLPVGVVATRPGPLLAATDNFIVTIKGTQAHAAYPHFGADPIVAAAHCVTALQTIASRNVSPLDSIVVTVATINGGTARNIIPQHAKFVGTMRTLTPEVRVLGRKRFFQIVQSTATAMGCEAVIDWEEGYPVTSNDPGATQRFFDVARLTLGAEHVLGVSEPSMGGEDFSYYGLRVPACFFVLGVRPADRATYPTLHQPEFDFNDDAMPTGIEVMCKLALQA
ncbi:MAG: amidohydrolase [Pyrinomonadaceae bacterium]|nr:amidohydrolase [Phycisphaerales bacterium]